MKEFKNHFEVYNPDKVYVSKYPEHYSTEEFNKMLRIGYDFIIDPDSHPTEVCSFANIYGSPRGLANDRNVYWNYGAACHAGTFYNGKRHNNAWNYSPPENNIEGPWVYAERLRNCKANKLFNEFLMDSKHSPYRTALQPGVLLAVYKPDTKHPQGYLIVDGSADAGLIHSMGIMTRLVTEWHKGPLFKYLLEHDFTRTEALILMTQLKLQRHTLYRTAVAGHMPWNPLNINYHTLYNKIPNMKVGDHWPIWRGKAPSKTNIMWEHGSGIHEFNARFTNTIRDIFEGPAAQQAQRGFYRDVYADAKSDDTVDKYLPILRQAIDELKAAIIKTDKVARAA
jgi:hypothetical protein